MIDSKVKSSFLKIEDLKRLYEIWNNLGADEKGEEMLEHYIDVQRIYSNPYSLKRLKKKTDERT